MRNNPLPPLLPSSGVRLILTTVTQGQVCQNGFDFQDALAAPVNAADMLAFGAAWIVANSPTLKLVLSPLTTLVKLDVIDVVPSLNPSQTVLFAPASLGLVGVANLPLEMGVTIRKLSNLKGQHGRGRLTLPAVPTTFTTPATDPNMLNAAGILAYSNWITATNIAYVVGPHQWQHYLVMRSLIPAVPPVRGTPVTSFLIDTLLGTARRRKEGRGR